MKEPARDLDCNVIRDLMPSYLDEICSEESRRLVDAHLISCAQCRTRIDLLKHTALTDERGEAEKISYLKKLKSHYMKKELISIVLLISAILGGFLLMQNYHTTLGLNSLYLSFALSVFAAYSLAPHHVEPSKASRLPSVLMVMSTALLIVYFMIVIVSLPIGSGAHVLHIPIDEIGYYLHRWLCWVAALQLGIFTAANLLRFRGYKLHKAIYGLTLTSAALASGFLRILGNLATVEAFYEMLAKMLICVVLEGILCSLLSCYIVKKMMQ